jgi:hypothetical protein
MYALLIPAASSRGTVQGARRRVRIPVRPPEFLGRHSECEALDRLLADALAGQSRVTVLRGEAGAGKSALLGYLSDRVAGWHVTRAVGVESEMELAYAGLHRWYGGVLGLHLGRVVSADRRIGCFRVRSRAVSGRCWW